MLARNSNKKKNGIVYTPKHLSDFVAKQLLSLKPINKESIKIFDPAIGEGELVYSLIEQIYPFNKNLKLYGFDTNNNSLEITANRIRKSFPEVEVILQNADFIQEILDSEKEKERFDYIIVNPPYVRTQELGTEQSQKLSRLFNLKGRIDLYYIFLLGVYDYLKEDGVAGFIVSNKFMNIKAGKNIRDFIINHYSLKKLFDLGDTNLFEATVLPALLFFSKGTTVPEKVDYQSVYKSSLNPYSKVDSLYEGFGKSQIVLFEGQKYKFESGILEIEPAEGNWILLTDEGKTWLEKVARKTWNIFGDIGKIRVGIKTTADNVFISEKFPDNFELSRPLITHRSAGQFIGCEDQNWEVIYTHETIDGKRKAVDLNKFPKTKEYLSEHYEQLSGRNYLRKAKRNWFEIWVPQNPESWKKTKIVFRDITEKPEFWIDSTGAIVNGDCYWIDFPKTINEDLIYLILGIANSEFIEKYYDLMFRTKLYSGKRRFISQYVEKFPIPILYKNESQEVIQLVKEIIKDPGLNIESKKAEINRLVNLCFGID